MKRLSFFNSSLIKKLSWFIIVVLISQSLIYCERKDRFYRPNLPEKICSIGIIDIDDSTKYNLFPNTFSYREGTRFISFEKSYQIEYPDEVKDSLRDFSFSISSEESTLFSYTSDSVIKDISGLNIPGDIDFHSGMRYFLYASERDFPDISAEVQVPKVPAKPELISVTRETVALPGPTPCVEITSAKSVVLEISFENAVEEGYYYALLLTGHVLNMSSRWPIEYCLLEYDVRYCNTPGFFAPFHGLGLPQWICLGDSISMHEVPVMAYFIDGSKVPNNQCILTVSSQFEDEKAPFSLLRSLQVRLLSIPRALYQFEKALYTFEQTADDPFTEPIYLNGNIIGGNGVFGICRSQELQVPFSPWFK